MLSVWPILLCRYTWPQGAELDANVHDAGLRMELKAGDTTMAEIEAAFALFCNAH